MKKGWEWKRIDEVCDFVSGLWKGEKPPLVRVGVIRNTNFTREGTLDRTDIAQIEVEQKKLEKRRLRYGDIILEKSGGGPKQPVGRVALFEIADGEFSFSNFTSALRVRDTGNVDFRYVHKCLYWLYQSGVTESMQTNSTGIRNLNADAYKSLTIPIPPLPEQQRIVGILDEAFAGLATAEANAARNLQNAREIFDSHLHAVFSQRGEGWVERKLEEVLTIQPQNGWSPPAANHSDSGTPVLTLSSVTGFVFRPNKLKYTSAKTDPKARYWIQNGDLLISRSNTPELVGHVAIASGIERPTIYPDLIMRMNCDPAKALTEFLYYLLRTPALREEITGRAQGANPTMKKISNAAVRTLPIQMPPLKEQRRIVTQLDALAAETQRLTRLYEQKQAALSALKKSLLQEAFCGEI